MLPEFTDSKNEAGASSNAVRALLANIIDYAGLFPPAQLEMAQTVANYARYLDDPNGWMLERLIVPVARLDEFERYAEISLPHGDDELPCPISALTAPAHDPEFSADLDRIAAFNDAHVETMHGLAVIDVIEIKAESASAIESAIARIPEEIFAFFEFSPNADPRGLIAALAGSDAGAKIRTGGISAEHYPTPETVANFIAACAASDVPFKATAGLHHPLTHRHPQFDVVELGFLNVFIAAALAYQRDLDRTTIAKVLAETSNKAFAFDGDLLRWREHTLTAEAIEDARLAFAISFGSCSFEEPRDDLLEMKLLP